MGAISGAVFAQSGTNLPLQRGVSVQLAVTTNAVAVPNADRQDALVVALTATAPHIFTPTESQCLIWRIE